MSHPVDRVGLSMISPTLPVGARENPSIISKIVADVLSNGSQAAQSSRMGLGALKEEENEKELSEVFEVLESFAQSSEPLSDAFIHLILHTDFVKQFKEEKKILLVTRSFFDLLIKESKSSLSALSPLKKISATAKGIEEILFGQSDGTFSEIHKEVKSVFSHIGIAKDVLSFLSLTGSLSYMIFRTGVLQRIGQKIKELENEKNLLPPGAKELEAKLQEQIEALSKFLKIEKQMLMKEVGRELLADVPKLLNSSQFCLDIAAKAMAGMESVASLSLASSIMGVVTSGLGLIKTGKEFYDCGRNFSRYEDWLHILQHRIDLVIPGESPEPTEIRATLEKISYTVQEEFKEKVQPAFFSSHNEEGKKSLSLLNRSMEESIIEKLKLAAFPNPQERAKELASDIMSRFCLHSISSNALAQFQLDPRVQTPSSNLEERGIQLQALKKEIRNFITAELKANNIPQAEGRAEILAHIQIRSLCHDIAVRESGSEEKARKKEMLSVSIKNGLTNLALQKREVEKTLYKAETVFKSMDATLSLVAFVASILTIVAVLCPPISSFVALGLAAGGALLFAATLIYQGVTRPNVFKLTWGSLDGWGGFIDRLKSKLYGWRLERAKAAAYSLEQKLAPTCFKIAILERLLLKDVPNKKELLSLIGVPVKQVDPTEVNEAIQRRIENLQKKIAPSDRKSFALLKVRIQDLSQKAKIVDEKLDAIKKRMAQACEKDNRELMKKTNGWENLELLLSEFKEGIAERLEDGDEMCVTILEELHESTGIRFDRKKIEEAITQKNHQNLLDAIGEPISQLVARREGHLKEIPALVDRKKQ